MLNDMFWEMVDDTSQGALIPFESANEDDIMCTILCLLITRGNRSCVNTCPVLKIRIEKGEVPWSDLQSESKI